MKPGSIVLSKIAWVTGWFNETMTCGKNWGKSMQEKSWTHTALEESDVGEGSRI